MEKSAKFQMTIHIDYDREENKIQFSMDSQTKTIRTLTHPNSHHFSANQMISFKIIM